MRASFAILAFLFIHSFSFAAEPLEFKVAQPNMAAFQETLSQIKELRSQNFLDPVICKLPKGNYRFTETLSFDSTLVGNGLRFVGDGINEVTFTGATSLNAEGEAKENLYRYSIPQNVELEGIPRVLLIEGKLRTAARYPNEGYLRIEESLPDKRSGFIVTTDDAANGPWPESGYDLVFLHDWSSSRLPVASFNKSDRVLKTLGPIGCAARHYSIDHFEKNPRYWLEGSPEFVDTEGEWAYDPATKQIILYSSQDTAPQVELPVVETLIDVAGTTENPLRALAFQGITFTGTRFPMPPGGLSGGQASMHEQREADGSRKSNARPMLPAAVKVSVATACRFQGCRFTDLGGTGLWLAGQAKNCRIERCKFQRLGGNGFNLGEDNSRRVDGKVWYQGAPDQVSTNNLISQCEVSFCGVVLPGSVGIWVPLSRELKIENNHIHDCPYTGISLGWMWNPSDTPAGNNRITANRIEYVMQVLSDGGGIYTLGKQPGSVISDNVITDIPVNLGRAESNGMFLDEGTTGFLIENNTIRRIDRSPLRFHKAGHNVAKNNHWELATKETPEVRYNNTPEKNIEKIDNEVVSPQQRIFLIGNSLTWDTIPSLLDEAPAWHVDCGKSLSYIQANPESPCVGTSRNWPVAFETTQYDIISFQPHYGTTLEEDVATISKWLELQPKAKVVIHTGWARSADFSEEWDDADPQGTLTHSLTYFNALLSKLREMHPQREFRSTRAMEALHQIQQDIAAGKAPFSALEDVYRDAIHMKLETGRYLAHNLMRQAVGQQRTDANWKELDPEIKSYLDGILDQFAPAE